MRWKPIDIRIVHAPTERVSHCISSFLRNRGFSQFPCDEAGEVRNERVSFRAVNSIRSFWLLIRTRAPQILDISLSNSSDAVTKVTIEFKLFKSFRMYSYGVLMTLFAMACCTAHVASPYTFGSSPASSSVVVLSLSIVSLFILLALGFTSKLIGITSRKFSEGLYEQIETDTGAATRVMQSWSDFPDIFIIFTLFFAGAVAFVAFACIKPMFIIIILAVPYTLICLPYFVPKAFSRTVFISIGFAASVGLAIYATVPLWFSTVVRPTTNYMRLQMMREAVIGSENAEVDQLHESLQRALNAPIPDEITLLGATILVVSVVVFCIILVIVVFFGNLVNNVKQMDEDRNHAELCSGLDYERGRLFRIFVVLWWLLLAVLNVVGIYFAASIFERGVFGVNFLCKSKIN